MRPSIVPIDSGKSHKKQIIAVDDIAGSKSPYFFANGFERTVNVDFSLLGKTIKMSS